MNALQVIGGALIAWGLLSILAPGLLWRLEAWKLLRGYGIKAERTPVWTRNTFIIGLACIVLGIYAIATDLRM